MPMFDAYVMVDWTSGVSPSPATASADAVWVGVLTSGGGEEQTYHRTRAAAAAYVRYLLLAAIPAKRRVLVGFDFPYGYPRGFAEHLGADGGRPPWRTVWDHLASAIADSPRNANNRFAVASAVNALVGPGPGPFWGCPPAAAADSLTTTMPFSWPYPTAYGPLMRLRATETALPGVLSTWQLYGAGSVGGQALVGIPRVHALRFDPDLRDVSRVWPFETGLTTTPAPSSGPCIVHAEIWPGIVDAEALATEMEVPGTIRDQAQVRLMCRWARDHDAAGTLGQWFGPGAVGTADPDVVVREEGWILGGPPLA